MLSAIIVAGGSSRRMGFDKTFAPLAGRPVIGHTIAAFEQATSVGEIIVVGRAERLPELKELIANAGFTKVRDVIDGGVQRQDSVNAGLKSVSADARFIAVHDAARPLITAAQIERVYESAQRHGAAALAAPVSDTLKRATDELLVCGSVDRERLYAMQTPQIFLADVLRAAFERLAADGVSVTDEVSALERIGQEVAVVANTDHNFKITFPADLALAELVLAARSNRC